jgi:hypothetical protein
MKPRAFWQPDAGLSRSAKIGNATGLGTFEIKAPSGGGTAHEAIDVARLDSNRAEIAAEPVYRVLTKFQYGHSVEN